MKLKLSIRASIICFCGLALMWAARGETNHAVNTEQVRRHFAKWDVNHNNALSLYEVELAAANSTIPAEERAVAAALGRTMRTKGLKSLVPMQLGAGLLK